MVFKKHFVMVASVLILLLAAPNVWADASIDGELKKWHKITLTFDGPDTDETANPNPFSDYRLDVTFTNGSSTYVVPGYFAADGNAADTGASGGNKWRVHFAPDKTGTWTYAVSFRTGAEVAVKSDANAGSPVSPLDGTTGSFEVAQTDKSGRDHRGKGLLQYVGEHYLKFAETGEYFLKQGADAPENFLAYDDFDNTPNNGGRRKSWEPHKGDWKNGDPTWNNGKGKGIIGAVNYLAAEGMNAFSFLPMNINGDDKNVFPYISDNSSDRKRMDCSKLEQWEIVFEHADKMGMFLHFKTQETENEMLLDNGNLGTERKLYYRELIARFGHHLALNWNLGEEINDASTTQKKSWAQYFHDTDPYRHHIVIHNGHNHYDLIGKGSNLTGFSLQTNSSDFKNVHTRVKDYLDRSAKAGKPWAVACDEPGDASHALRPDSDAGNSHEDGRKNGLWGTFLAGGWGNEWYFGYQHAHSDLTCQDFRSRDKWWDYCRHALEFFKKNTIPFWQMKNDNNLSSASNDYCLYKKGHTYIVYLKNGGTTDLKLTDVSGEFDVRWYDPRNGGGLKTGSVSNIQGGDNASLGNAPDNTGKDWVILVTLSDASNTPPTADAGQDQIVADTDGNGSESVTLDGGDSTDSDGSIESWQWKQGDTIIGTESTQVVDLPVGTHTLSLTVTDNDGATDTDSVSIQVTNGNPQVSSVTSLTLVNADSNKDITVLNNGDTVNLATLPTRNLTVRADTEPTQVSSVTFSLSGATEKSHTELNLPYALWGDQNGDYGPGAFNVGEHVLLAEPTMDGVAGTSMKISFTVIDESSPDNNPPAIESGPSAEPNPVTLPDAVQLSLTATDPEGDSLTYTWSVVSGPATVTFDPNSGELSDQCDAALTAPGEYVIQVMVSDGEYNVEKNLTLTALSAENNPPSATKDNYSTKEDTILEVKAPGVLSNDTDADGDPLTAILVDDTANGLLTLASDGSFSYTPEAGFTGTDTFTYRAADGESESPAATVSIAVDQESPGSKSAITGFTLINADTDETIMDLSDGEAIEVSMLADGNINIRAHTEPTVVSQVKLVLSGETSKAQTENHEPYALWGNNGTDYQGGTLNIGEHTLTATPYLDGAAGESLTINFTISEDPALDAPDFVLVDAEADEDLTKLNPGETIDLSQLPTRKINIRAEIDPEAADYVKLTLIGETSKTRTEKVSPYALWGDTNGDYYEGSLKTGTYTLKAVPYKDGKAGKPMMIEFEVVDN